MTGGRHLCPWVGYGDKDLSSATSLLAATSCGGWGVHYLKALPRGSLWELGSSPGLAWPATCPTGAANIKKKGLLQSLPVAHWGGGGGILVSSGFTHGPNTGQTRSMAV